MPKPSADFLTTKSIIQDCILSLITWSITCVTAITFRYLVYYVIPLLLLKYIEIALQYWWFSYDGCDNLIYQHDLAYIKAWLSNLTRCSMWDAIAHPCPNVNSGSAKPSI